MSDPGILDPSKILVGAASANNATIITIPAGKVWKGKISLNAALSVAASGSAVSSRATVSVAGSTATPAAGVVLGVFLAVPAPAASTAGIAVTGRDETDIIVVAGTSAATLTLQINSVSAATATASGQIVN